MSALSCLLLGEFEQEEEVNNPSVAADEQT